MMKKTPQRSKSHSQTPVTDYMNKQSKRTTAPKSCSKRTLLLKQAQKNQPELAIKAPLSITTTPANSPEELTETICSHHTKRFQIQKLLDTGGLSHIYLATDLARVAWSDTNPLVVLKKLRPEIAQNGEAKLALAHEFFMLRHIAHPGVIRVFDLHMQDDDIYISMEYLEGKNINTMIDNLPAGFGNDAFSLIDKLIDTVHYLHQNGIIHGDIKPSNLFLTQENRLVLLDFNMAQCKTTEEHLNSPMHQGLQEKLQLPSYSLLYASPERIITKTPSFSDDLYSLSVTIYALLTGELPFKRWTSQEAQKKQLQPIVPQIISRKNWQALQDGLQFDPSKRCTIADLCQQFQNRRTFFSKWWS